MVRTGPEREPDHFEPFGGSSPKFDQVAEPEPWSGPRFEKLGPKTGRNHGTTIPFPMEVRWVILPAGGNVFSPARSCSPHFDIISQRFIASKMSIPLPQIHYWSLDADNLLS